MSSAADLSRADRRANFADGLPLGAADLEAERAWIDGRQRWLTRTLLGAGVVTGVGDDLALEISGARLVVGTGCAIDRAGRLVTVTEPWCLDDLASAFAQAGVDTLVVYLAFRANPADPVSSPASEIPDGWVATRLADGLALSLEPALSPARNGLLGVLDEPTDDGRVPLGAVRRVDGALEIDLSHRRSVSLGAAPPRDPATVEEAPEAGAGTDDEEGGETDDGGVGETDDGGVGEEVAAVRQGLTHLTLRVRDLEIGLVSAQEKITAASALAARALATAEAAAREAASHDDEDAPGGEQPPTIQPPSSVGDPVERWEPPRAIVDAIDLLLRSNEETVERIDIMDAQLGPDWTIRARALLRVDPEADLWTEVWDGVLRRRAADMVDDRVPTLMADRLGTDWQERLTSALRRSTDRVETELPAPAMPDLVAAFNAWNAEAAAHTRRYATVIDEATATARSQLGVINTTSERAAAHLASAQGIVAQATRELTSASNAATNAAAYANQAASQASSAASAASQAAGHASSALATRSAVESAASTAASAKTAALSAQQGAEAAQAAALTAQANAEQSAKTVTSQSTRLSELLTSFSSVKPDASISDVQRIVQSVSLLQTTSASTSSVASSGVASSGIRNNILSFAAPPMESPAAEALDLLAGLRALYDAQPLHMSFNWDGTPRIAADQRLRVQNLGPEETHGQRWFLLRADFDLRGACVTGTMISSLTGAPWLLEVVDTEAALDSEDESGPLDGLDLPKSEVLAALHAGGALLRCRSAVAAARAPRGFSLQVSRPTGKDD